MSKKFGFFLGAVACFAAAAGFLHNHSIALSALSTLGGFVCAYKSGTAKN